MDITIKAREEMSLIPAIRAVRELTGMPLKEAKQLVDSIKKGGTTTIDVCPVQGRTNQHVINVLDRGSLDLVEALPEETIESLLHRAATLALNDRMYGLASRLVDICAEL